MNEQASVAVAVNMVDNYTKPFRKAVEAARRNTSSMVSEHKNLLHLQDASKRYQKLFDTIGAGKSKIKAHANALAEARERARQLTGAIAATHSPTKKMLAQKVKAHREVNRLSNAMREERQSVIAAREALRGAGIEVKRFGEHQRKLQDQIGATTQKLRAQASVSAKKELLKTNMDRGLARASSLTFAGAATSQTGRNALDLVRSPFAAAMNFADEMANVDKFVKGANIAELRKRILQQGGNSPLGATGLARLVAEAGKTGLSGDDAFRSAMQTERAAVAFDIDLQTAAERNNKFRASMNLSLDQVGKLNDAINYFGDNSASSADNISNIVTRSGGVAKAAGFSPVEIAGLAAAMDSVSSNSEKAATSMKNVANALTIGDAAGGRAKDAYTQLGLDPQAIAEGMARDASGTLSLVLSAIGRQDSAQIPKLVEMLFGRESQATVSGLVNNMGMFTQTMQRTADETAIADSTNKEYARNMARESAQAQKAKAKLEVVLVRLGATLLPPFVKLLHVAGSALEAVGGFVDKFPGLSAAVMGGIAVVGGLGLVIGPALTAVASLTAAIVTLRYASARAALGVQGAAAGTAGRGGLGKLRGLPKWMKLGGGVAGAGYAALSLAPVLMSDDSAPNKANAIAETTGGIGGALAGAKAGALAGALLGPFGAAAGALVGSVAGGIGGQWLASNLDIGSWFAGDDAVAAKAGVNHTSMQQHNAFNVTINQQPGEDAEDLTERLRKGVEKNQLARMDDFLFHSSP